MKIDRRYNWITPNLINYLIGQAKDDPARNKWVTNARRFRTWYRGESFLAPVSDMDDMEIDERNATARKNIIGEVVDEVSSLFLKNTPVVRRLPFVPWHGDLSNGLDALWLWAWRESKGQAVFRSVMEDSQITGLGVGQAFWDPRKTNRHYPGMVAIKHIPGESVYVDPNASNDHSGMDIKFVIKRLKYYPEELIASFGDPAAVALGWRSAVGRKKDWSGIVSMHGMSNVDARQEASRSGKLIYDPSGSDNKNRSSEKVEVHEAWLFPENMYGSELAASGNIPEEYRFGVVATMIRDKIISVDENPNFKRAKVVQTDERGVMSRRSAFIGHGTHPFFFLHWRPSADKDGNRRFYDTMGMVEWMISQQFNVNALRRNMAIILRTMANPTVIYNEDALATMPSNLMFLPGQVYKVRGNFRVDDAIKVIQPTAMPAQVQQMIAEDIQGIKTAGGVKPGVTSLFPAPGGGTSHTPSQTIGTLQEAAFASLWRYVTSVGDCLERISTLYDGLLQQHCEAAHYMGVDKTGEEIYTQWTGDHRAAQFRRIVVAGATTPVFDIDRQQREAQVLEMTISALTSGDPRVMRAVLISLDNIRVPWVYQYAQLLEEEIERTLQLTQGAAQLGEAALAQGQLALPQHQGVGPTQQSAGGLDVEQLASEFGVTPEQLKAAVSQ